MTTYDQLANVTAHAIRCWPMGARLELADWLEASDDDATRSLGFVLRRWPAPAPTRDDAQRLWA